MYEEETKERQNDRPNKLRSCFQKMECELTEMFSAHSKQ